jgi:hypothetical protein
VTGLALVALWVAWLAFGAGAALAQPPNTPPGIDHYLVYPVIDPPFFTATLLLDDQFIRHRSHITYTLDFFMIPVDKNFEGIIDSLAHYTWWRINEIPFGATALVSNQFGTDQELKVHLPRYLLNPALKNEPVGTPIPYKNHYVAYDVEGLPLDFDVFLHDQFYQLQAHVDTVKFLAPPAAKFYNEQNFPILDPVAHLTIYRIMPLPPFTPTTIPVFVIDQFGTWNFQLGPPICLAVPSYKTGVVPVVPTTWSRIKATYR